MASCHPWKELDTLLLFTSKPYSYSRVCGLHFKSHEFITQSQDEQTRRQRRVFGDNLELTIKRLVPGAVPSVFPNIPKYLSNPIQSSSAPPRSQRPLSSTRRASQEQHHDRTIETFMEADKCCDIKELDAKLDRSLLPNGITELRRDDKLIFLFFEEYPGNIELIWYVIVTQDCSVIMKRRNVIVPNTVVAHLVPDQKIRLCSQLLNLLSTVKSFSEDFGVHPQALTSLVDHFKEKASQLILDESKARKLNFLLDQLALTASSNKKQRRYSADLLACCALWQTTSPALYRQMLNEDILCLPSIRHLKNLTCPLNTATGMNEKAKIYLSERLKSLSEREKVMVLMIDEIYCAQRVEFMGGNFFGLMDSSQPVKTVLVFMIKSIAGPFKDTVALFPIANLDSKIMKTTTFQVLEALESLGCRITLLSLDNASANRKFYVQELCDGLLTPSIPHPEDSSRPLFLSFDPVHCFKNIYNNFQTRKKLQCPLFQESGVICPSFTHIEELFQMEKGKPVKMAYKLTHKVISPSSIEKTNVKLADAVFHDSTIDTMEFFVNEGTKPEWGDTVTFLKIIRQWWNIVNVKTPGAGKRKRDPRKEPIFSKSSESFIFLQNFESWLGTWEGLEGCHKLRSGLTRETFLATIQTTRVLTRVTEHLLDVEHFEFVLLGQLQSDVIESHFGWVRQLAGGNYYVSLRQILEAEKSIKLRSLVRYSDCKLEDLKVLFKSVNEVDKKQVQTDSMELLDKITVEDEFDFQNEDQNLIYYVSGYLGRSLCNRKKCHGCNTLFSKDSELTIKFQSANNEQDRLVQASFFEQVNRGGLIPPSDLMFAFCLQVLNFYNIIQRISEAKAFLTTCKNQRDVFAMTFCKRVNSNTTIASLFDVHCDSGHGFEAFWNEIARRMFNFFAKNLCTEINSSIHSAKRRKTAQKNTPGARKIAKLQSTTL